MKKVLIYNTSNITAYICYGRPALMGSTYAVGKGGLPPTAYAYNVRSWVTHVSSPLFSQSLSYGEHADGGTPRYDGAISAMDWQRAVIKISHLTA